MERGELVRDAARFAGGWRDERVPAREQQPGVHRHASSAHRSGRVSRSDYCPVGQSFPGGNVSQKRVSISAKNRPCRWSVAFTQKVV